MPTFIKQSLSDSATKGSPECMVCEMISDLFLCTSTTCYSPVNGKDRDMLGISRALTSSIESLTIYRVATTSRLWPILWTLSSACSSAIGLHCGSRRWTRDAAVRSNLAMISQCRCLAKHGLEEIGSARWEIPDSSRSNRGEQNVVLMIRPECLQRRFPLLVRPTAIDPYKLEAVEVESHLDKIEHLGP